MDTKNPLTPGQVQQLLRRGAPQLTQQQYQLLQQGQNNLQVNQGIRPTAAQTQQQMQQFMMQQMSQNGKGQFSPQAMQNSPLMGSPMGNPQMHNSMTAQQLQQYQQQMVGKQMRPPTHIKLNARRPAAFPSASGGQGIPIFSASPQQAARVFQTNPLHGLLDAGSVQADLGSTPTIETPRFSMEETSHSSFVPDSHEFSKKRLHQLLEDLDPMETMTGETEERLLQLADHFITQVTHRASKIAKHGNSTVLQVKDIQLELEHNWKIIVPGFEAEPTVQRKLHTTTQHQAKLMAVERAKRDLQIVTNQRIREREDNAKEMMSNVELTGVDKDIDEYIESK